MEERFYRPVPKDLNNCFRDWEKFYRKPPTGQAAKKLKSKPTDFTNVIDFSDLDNNTSENRNRIIDLSDTIRSSQVEDDRIPVITKFYGLEGVPGFLFIPNPFTPDQQQFWTKKCVREYTVNNPTNVVNIQMINWRKEHENYTEEEEREYERVSIIH